MSIQQISTVIRETAHRIQDNTGASAQLAGIQKKLQNGQAVHDMTE
ncbi:MAG: hypothetical protein LBQ00_04065 [Syntrophobacterales bacterium]|jgi:hypothetical protein|nr:hypothetical protein [Syntrophobacterales bacterium]